MVCENGCGPKAAAARSCRYRLVGCLAAASEPGEDPGAGEAGGQVEVEEGSAKDKRQHKSKENPMLLQITQATCDCEM